MATSAKGPRKWSKAKAIMTSSSLITTSSLGTLNSDNQILRKSWKLY